MGLIHIVRKILDGNEWLNGMADYYDGDITAPANKAEIFEREPTEIYDIKKLFTTLLNYEGVYKHKNLLFFNDAQYGCFIYDINNPESYIEHYTIDAMTYESFRKTTLQLIKQNH